MRGTRIDWLVKNVPNNNGRVGMSGISYPGFYTACGAIDSHPALKAVSPQAPIADWFIGDDWHHNGAFYLAHAFRFLARFEQKLENRRARMPKPFDYETPDGYEFYRNLGPLANVDARLFKGSIAYWNELMQHGTYDEYLAGAQSPAAFEEHQGSRAHGRRLVRCGGPLRHTRSVSQRRDARTRGSPTCWSWVRGRTGSGTRTMARSSAT